MNFQTALNNVLSSVSSGKFFPLAAPRDCVAPFVIYRVKNRDTLMTLQGEEGTRLYTVEFNCIGKTYLESINAAEEVRATLMADLTLIKYHEPEESSAYLNETDEFMEPLVFSFWHVP